MSLTPATFLDRYLTHVPMPRLQTVRGYILYGPRQATALDRARASLGQAPVAEPEPLSPEQFLARFERTPQASRCPQCSALLRFVSALLYDTGPPCTLH